MIYTAIDPGNERSAYVVMDDDRPVLGEIVENEELLRMMSGVSPMIEQSEHVAIEMIASYGMPVGAEVFDTCVWIGRFAETVSASWTLVFRREVKMHLCGSSRANDSNIRQALLDRYGPGKSKAVGTKKDPGPCYGFKKDIWAALGVAVTWYDAR